MLLGETPKSAFWKSVVKDTEIHENNISGRLTISVILTVLGFLNFRLSVKNIPDNGKKKRKNEIANRPIRLIIAAKKNGAASS